MTFLPWLVGGPLLGGLADRCPRRTVMVACNVLSALLVAALAVPGQPVALLCVVLFLAVLLESPFLSARAALIADILPDDRYVLASALNNLTVQLAQVLGFAVGGALVAVLGRAAGSVSRCSHVPAVGCHGQTPGSQPARGRRSR